MISFFKTFFHNPNPTISYGITVCNESKEVELLLESLIHQIGDDDEVIILQDVTNKNLEVDQVLKKYENKIIRIESKLNGDFAAFKNNLISKASKDFLFQIDADEMPKESLIKNIKSKLKKHSRCDCFLVPRINTVEGITENHIKEWKWQINEKGYINYPDYQQRLFKLDNKIFWKNIVHEALFGYKKIFFLPSETEEFCLVHKKEIIRQTQQNALYEKIEKERS